MCNALQSFLIFVPTYSLHFQQKLNLYCEHTLYPLHIHLLRHLHILNALLSFFITIIIQSNFGLFKTKVNALSIKQTMLNLVHLL